MTAVGTSAWCGLVTELLRGEHLLDVTGFSMIQLGFATAAGEPVRWTHASFLDGQVCAWVAGPARRHDLSVVVPADAWLAPRPDVASLLRTVPFAVEGRRATVLPPSLDRRLAALPTIRHADVHAVLHLLTGPFGAFDLHYIAHDGRVELAVDPPPAPVLPDIVVSAWCGHVLGALTGHRHVLAALERGQVLRGDTSHLLLLAGLIESAPHRAAFAADAHVHATIARHADLLGAPAIRVAARTAAHRDAA